MDYSSCKKLIDVLVLSFEAMFSPRVQVRKKDFCTVLTGKQPKCRDSAPLLGKGSTAEIISFRGKRDLQLKKTDGGIFLFPTHIHKV